MLLNLNVGEENKEQVKLGGIHPYHPYSDFYEIFSFYRLVFSNLRGLYIKRTKINDMENLFKAHYMKMYRLDILILREENVSKDT